MKNKNYIGFKADSLSFQPVRLPVLYSQNGLLVLEKPLDVLVDIHPWFPDAPAIIPELRLQIKERKQELSPYHLRNLQSLLHLEANCSGLALMATDNESIEHYRNLIGSEKVEFTFQLLAYGGSPAVGEVKHCDLPLAKNPKRPLMHVSHRYGKKTFTSFKCLDVIGNYSWWEAKTHFYRMHQVVLHAWESGIHVVGDPVYSKIKPIFLSELTRLNKPPIDEEFPIYSGVCLDLVSVKGLVSEVIAKPLDKKLQILDKKLKKYLNS